MPQLTELFQTLPYGPAPESAAAADAWLDRHDRRFDHFIDNQWTPPANGRYLTTTNPARGEDLAQFADASAPDIDAAVTAARAAYAPWSALSPHQRARHLYAIARNVQKHARMLAVLESLDNGKPIREARDIDVPLVARHFYHHAGWAQLLESEMRRLSAPGRCWPGHPLELPAADAGLEDRAGAGDRQHGRHKAGALHATDRPALRRNHRRGRPAAGGSQYRHRRRRSGRGAGGA